MRHIIIESCRDCPYMGHGGALGKVKYKPWCTKLDKRLKYKTYEIDGRVIARFSGTVPNWCPLDTFNKEEL